MDSDYFYAITSSTYPEWRLSSGFQRLAIFTRGVNSLEMTDAASSEPDAEGIWMSVMVNNCLQTGSRADPPPLKITGRLIYRGAPDAEPSCGRDNVRFCCLHCTGGKFAVVIATSRTIFVHVSAPRRFMKNHILAALQELPAFSFPAVPEAAVAIASVGLWFKTTLPHSRLLSAEIGKYISLLM